MSFIESEEITLPFVNVFFSMYIVYYIILSIF